MTHRYAGPSGPPASSPPPTTPAGGPGLTPVTPQPRRAALSTRWIVALVATALVIGTVVAGVVLLSRAGASVPASASYLPVSTFFYVEGRL